MIDIMNMEYPLFWNVSAFDKVTYKLLYSCMYFQEISSKTFLYH